MGWKKVPVTSHSAGKESSASFSMDVLLVNLMLTPGDRMGRRVEYVFGADGGKTVKDFIVQS